MKFSNYLDQIILITLLIILFSSLSFAGQCAGKCGVYIREADCKCDALCEIYGDCCKDICDDCPELKICQKDYPLSTSSCVGRCGVYDPKAPCQCDIMCYLYKGKEGCCSDICQACPTNPKCAVTTIITTTINTTIPCYNCQDSDGGINIYTKGYITGLCYGQYYFYYDYCLGNNLVEFYCAKDGSYKSSMYQCSKGCYDGRCIEGTTTTTTIYTPIPTTTTTIYTPIPTTTTTVYASCSDTDFVDIYTKGYVYGYYQNGNYYLISDYCFSYNSVVEYYCSGYYDYKSQKYIMSPHSSVYDCTYGCYDGRCIKGTTTTTTIYTPIPTTTTTIYIPNFCTDTDGGYNIYTKGTVSGYYNSKYYSITDYCLGNNINEYYCYNNIPYSYTRYCQYGCSSGACKISPTEK